jgi:hypothetical protein
MRGRSQLEKSTQSVRPLAFACLLELLGTGVVWILAPSNCDDWNITKIGDQTVFDWVLTGLKDAAKKIISVG